MFSYNGLRSESSGSEGAEQAQAVKQTWVRVAFNTPDLKLQGMSPCVLREAIASQVLLGHV